MKQFKIDKSIPRKEGDYLEKYINEIRRSGSIDPEEEATLAIKIHEGDQHAFEKLTKANLLFVVSVAKIYQNQGLPISDIINEGNLGLMKAVKLFDETKGFKLITFAVWWIRREIITALCEHSRTVRLPVNIISLMHKISLANLGHEQEHGYEPAPEDLADILKKGKKEVKNTIRASAKSISIDESLPECESKALIETLINPNQVVPDETLKNEALRIDINRSLGLLKPIQSDVLRLYFGIGIDYPMSIEDIAEKFSRTGARIRQIRDEAIENLRSEKSYEILRTYLK